jgi:predicted DNA-binding protein
MTKRTRSVPPVTAGAMKHRANLRLPEDIQQRVDRVGEVDRRKATDVLRWALELGLDELEQRLGLARKK